MAHVDIAVGNHVGVPTCWGFTVSKNGHDQIAIEFAVRVPTADGGERVVNLTRFGGIEGQGLEYTVRDLRTCGWAGDDLARIELDTKTPVRLVVADKGYGPEIRSIYALDGTGGLIAKQAMPAERQRELVARLNARLASLPTPTAAPKPKPAAASSGPDDGDLPF